MHIALITRSTPSFSLARLNARDQVVEIGASDLRFSPAEVNDFLEQMNIHPDPAETALLNRSTEGWAVGLQLAALAMTRHPFRLDLPAGRAQVFEYLAEEVLRREAPHVQTFLMHTALFERFSLPLCEALLDEQPLHAETLLHVEQANLFLVPLDSGGLWYRYHALFTDFLRQRFREQYPQEAPSLYRRASLWFEQNAMLEDAIHYATHAGDHTRAVHLIESHYRELLQRGEQAALLQWLDDIPRSFTETRPGLLLAMGWAYAITLDSAQAERCASQAESLLPLSEEGYAMRLEVKALRILTHIFQAQTSVADEISADFIRFSEKDDFLHSLLHFNLGMYFTLSGETRRAVDIFKETIQMESSLNNPLLTIAAWRQMGEEYQIRGEFGLAERAFQEVIAYAQQSLGKHTVLLGMPLVSYAELLREMNRFPEARRQAEQGIEYCQQWQSMAGIDGMITLARIEAGNGEWEKAFAQFEEARKVTAKTKTFLNDIFLFIYLCRLYLLHGDLRQARHLIERYQLETYFADKAFFLQETVGLILLRLRILEASDDPVEVARLAGEVAALLPDMEQGERVSPWIEAQLLRVYALHAARKHSEACAALSSALQKGEQCGYVRIFADEGERLLHILDQYRSRLNVERGYLETIVALLSQRAEHSVPVISNELPPFTRREMDILALMAAGKSNQEIAAELVLALNTVKKHVANILDKLGVANRTQAVSLARKQGWLQ